MRPRLIRVVRNAALSLSVLALGGCASMNVSSYIERGTDLRQYRSFDWGPADTFTTGDPRLDNNRFFDEYVRAHVEKQLASRGFTKASSASPDLLVHYHASVTQKIDVRELDHPWSYCDRDDCRPFVHDAGTLFVDLVDPRTNKLVWRGWAEGGIDRIDDQDGMEARLDEAITRILQRLPAEL